MRIAWFTQRYHPIVGGAENYGREIVRRFVADGHDVDVLASDAQDLWYFTDPSRGRLDAPLKAVIDGANVRRFPIRHWFGQKYAGRLLSYLPNWRAQCRYESFMPIVPGIDRVRGPYDAVFSVAFPYTLFSHAAYKTARAARAPLIITPFLHLATPGDKVNRIYTRPHQGRLLREAATVVTMTRLEADAVSAWGVDRDKILTLGAGVDHAAVTGGDRFALRDKLGIPRHRRAIGHLTTLDPNKGTVDLVKAVQALNANRGSEPIHLILAGNSSPQYEAFEAALPPETSRWLTRVKPWSMERRPEFFGAIDLFSMPSRTDSFGIVFLEAWANGLPVVAAAAGGVPDVVKDGETGLLVPFGDLDKLSVALDRLLTDRDLARTMGEAGRRLVDTGYTWDDRYRTLGGRIKDLTARRVLLGAAG
jgi:glycosyltransferase involved in cell wall biosynthesis